MYNRLDVADSIRVPPKNLGEDLEESIKQALKDNVEGTISKEAGVVLSVDTINSIEGGEIEPEDAGVHYETEYEAVVYEPEMKEVVNGEVVDITSFGAFIRIGPLDGLCHVSQIMDEYVNLDEENNMLVSDEGDKTLEIGDKVTARIIAVSLGNEDSNKINLTMRQPGLGKDCWIEDYEEQQAEEEEEEE
ncbi:MAG: DNA-directed RNA polymerase, rpoE [Candidatus Nanosalina sp. J07AB43]|jgi:DNA-directed RNA polymerase (rpoE), archaeal and eukaryotic form|nr:MAG: DNA-directed RNA polymerase, rpoE [Candidatus Nanosalina sp. J07AB43]